MTAHSISAGRHGRWPLRSCRRPSARNEFGRVLAAYGGVVIVGSIAWGIAFGSFRRDRYDLAGAAICLVGVAAIIYAPRLQFLAFVAVASTDP